MCAPLLSEGRPASFKGCPAIFKGYPANSKGYPADSKGYPVNLKGRPANFKGCTACILIDRGNTESLLCGFGSIEKTVNSCCLETGGAG
jgi:hypothetical protein